MTFAIDAGPALMPQAKGALVDDTMNVRFTTWSRADRCKRQILEAIYSADDLNELDEYVRKESVVIDGLFLYSPEMAAEITDAHSEVRIGLGGQTLRPAAPDIPSPPSGQIDKETRMTFSNFDTGPGGSEGPWLSWSARGTHDNQVPAKTFYIRDDAGKTPFDMSNGIVMDIDNMKTGWCYSAGVMGQAPDWKWNPSIASFAPKPGDDYKKGLSVRCAIGGGKTATWEDSGAGAWQGFVDLVPQLQQGPGDGSLPLVRMTGVRDEKYSRGSTSIPVLEVVKWVPRPDCLKEGAAASGIATDAAPAQQATPAPAPASAPATADEF